MGKTSDKLNYLDGTRQKIKQAIIDKGESVLDTDTFRSYADKIKNIKTKEDLTVELEDQEKAIDDLEEAVNNLPEPVEEPEGTIVIKENGIHDVKAYEFADVMIDSSGGVAVNVVGAWTINPDGSANTINGIYYNFTVDGKAQAILNGDVNEMGAYTVDGNKIHLTAEGEELTWYYNEDGGIAVEENAESIMWRLVPQGTLKVKENGDYDVTPNTKVSVDVPSTGGSGSLSFYDTEIVVDENGYNVLQLTETAEIGENVYAVGQTNENDTLYVINA